MGILDIFQSKKRDNRNNHSFSDSDRQLANMRRESNKMFNSQMLAMKNRQMILEQEYQMKLRQKQIDELDDEDEDEDDYEDEDYEESALDKFVGIFAKAMNKTDIPKGMTAQEIVDKIPEDQRQKLRAMSPEQIKEMATLYYPNLSKELVEMIIPLL
jgi:hypothetical protein